MRLNTRPRVRWAKTKANIGRIHRWGAGQRGGWILDRRGPGGGSQTRTGGARTSRQKTESISHTQGTASEGRQNIQNIQENGKKRK